MALPLLIPLISLGISAVGTGIQAGQNAKANRMAEDNYNSSRQRLLTDMNENPLDSVANKALLSQMDRRLNKRERAIDNQAAAGGATFENRLAAKQASNEAMADVVSSIMQGETARQDMFRNQLLDIESRRTQQRAAAMQQSGAAWASMANNVASSFNTFGGTMIENGVPVDEWFKFR